MPRRKKSTPAEQPSKAEMIRQTAKSLGGKVRPRDIVAALKEKGVAVSPNLVSKTLKAAGLKPKRRGRKVATSTSSATDVSKAELIRQTAQSIPKPIRPRDIIAHLKEQGVEVSYALVSSTLRAAGLRRRRRGRKAGAKVIGMPAAANGLNLDALIAAKSLIEKVGGIENAQTALSALKKLR
jgi:lambda repressor-like predicted transcriptional regulator